MTNDDVVNLVRFIYGQPQFAHFTVTPDNIAAYRDELSDLPITGELAKSAVRELLRDNDQRLPTPQAIRRRILTEAGVLAPSWAEALTMIGEWEQAVASGSPPPRLPGPVMRAIRARGTGSGDGQWTAQMRQTYQEFAEQHDRVVMGPDGLQVLAETARWFEAVAERDRLMRLARQAVAIMTPPLAPLELPAPNTPIEVLQQIVDAAEREVGPLDQLDAVTVDRSEDLRALIEGKFRG